MSFFDGSGNAQYIGDLGRGIAEIYRETGGIFAVRDLVLALTLDGELQQGAIEKFLPDPA